MDVGLFSFTDQELAQTHIDLAQQAWDQGDPILSQRIRLTAGAKNDADAILAHVLHGVTDIGWTVHTATPYMQTVGPNAEMVLLILERPAT